MIAHGLRDRSTRVTAPRAIDALFRAIAAILVASLAAAAWHDVSKGWDVWFYHLPFAGRIVGLVDPASYAFGRANEARYAGFPLLAEAVQGALWRITGRPECANLVAFAAIPALAWFGRRLDGVPPHLTALALVAIPLVQIHATSSYIDLPSNACAAMLILLARRAVVERRPPSLRLVAGAGALAAAAANAKFQLVPIVLAACAVVVVRAAAKDERRAARIALAFAFVPIVLAMPIKNLLVHGNPVWPVELHVLGHAFPSVEGAYSSSPPWLEHAPRPIRFLCSALEIGLRPIASHRRWSLDQWTPPAEDGYRMGGFFGAYVALNVIALVVAVVKQRSREARVAGLFVLGTTIVVSLMPQSHELRYYMVWMLVLVATNLALWARARPLATGAVACVAIAIVGWSTEGTYLYPSGDSFATLVATKTDEKAIDAIAPGERVCVSAAPWTFLYAPRFHGKRYVVQEAEDDADCAGARKLWP